jgi:ribosomal protein S18 acetylase RimI-like enzyme
MSRSGLGPDVSIERAEPVDAEAILALQRLAYRSEAALYGDYSIPPLTESLEELRAVFDEGAVVLRAMRGGRLVGSVRARLRGGTCEIARLIVHPELQGRGIGRRLMAEIEACFPEASRFALFTGDRSQRNLRIYERLGYQRRGSEAQTEKVTIIHLEKPNAAATGG